MKHNADWLTPKIQWKLVVFRLSIHNPLPIWLIESLCSCWGHSICPRLIQSKIALWTKKRLKPQESHWVLYKGKMIWQRLTTFFNFTLSSVEHILLDQMRNYFSSVRCWTARKSWHLLFILLEDNRYWLSGVHTKKLKPSVCWLTNPIWPYAIHSDKPSVSLAACSSKCSKWRNSKKHFLTIEIDDNESSKCL